MDSIIAWFKNLFSTIFSGEVYKPEEEVRKVKMNQIPRYGDFTVEVRFLQDRLVSLGFDPGKVDGDFGPRTRSAVSAFQKSKGLRGSGVIGPKTMEYLGFYIDEGELTTPVKPSKAPPWYTFAKKYEGKRETDKEFADYMVPQWKLVGLKLKTISTNWAAWCGLAMAVALYNTDISWQKDGALAKNWAKYGVAIDWKKDGIPRGAIIHINRNCGSSSGNHVTQADGDCTAKYLNKKGATINGYGGNQGNTWKVSTYPVSRICAVRWPKDYPKPPPVEKSDRCTSGKMKEESTR